MYILASTTGASWLVASEDETEEAPWKRRKIVIF